MKDSSSSCFVSTPTSPTKDEPETAQTRGDDEDDPEARDAARAGQDAPGEDDPLELRRGTERCR